MVWGSNQSSASEINRKHIYSNGDEWVYPTDAGNSARVVRNGTTPFHQAQYSGNYYNWYTATAGTGTYAMVSENAPSSVCPKGWKLPTGGEGGQFAALTDAMVGIFTNTYDIRDKSYDMQFSPNYFILSGYYYNSTSDFRTYAGTSGY